MEKYLILLRSNDMNNDLTLIDCEHLFWLAARDIVFFSTYNEDLRKHDDYWHAAINCNDTFYYACADAYGIEPQEAQSVRTLFEKWGWSGVVAWVAIKINEEPIKELQTENYKAALTELK